MTVIYYDRSSKGSRKNQMTSFIFSIEERDLVSLLCFIIMRYVKLAKLLR